MLTTGVQKAILAQFGFQHSSEQRNHEPHIKLDAISHSAKHTTLKKKEEKKSVCVCVMAAPLHMQPKCPFISGAWSSESTAVEANGLTLWHTIMPHLLGSREEASRL